ncbi:MAG: PAS domain-containing protein [Bacteroidales bacterium]|nr:PAS domain-containing protein [Bacteroidales bacterium]MDD4673823.1 PAS domain-containing protein [Bacteroidales bacterium]
MKIKLNIRQKIFFSVLSASMVLYIIAVGYIVTNSRKTMIDDALLNAQKTATIEAQKIEKDFERNLTVTRTLAQAFSIYKDLPTEQWQNIFKRMYLPVLESNKHVYSIWDSWEFYGYIPNYTKDYGRYSATLWREGGEIISSIEYRSLDGDGEIYGNFKKLNQEDILEPYVDEGDTQAKSELILMTSLLSPIRKDGQYVGLVGFDIGLSRLQEVVSEIEPVPGSYAFLVSTQGLIAAHQNGELINKPLSEVFASDYDAQDLGNIISKGQEHSYFQTTNDGKEHYITFAPIKPGNSFSTWSLALSIPMDVITQRADKSQRVSLLVGAIGLLLLTLILVIVANSVTRPIIRITKSLNRMQQGEISSNLILNLNTGDEFEAMANSLNTSIEALNKKTNFANDIGKGHLESELEILGEKDILGKSLLNMRNSLQKAKEEENKRKTEDKKRVWANEGFAKFADLLRQNNDDLQKLTDEVIAHLVKYVGGNQGALFLVDDEDKNDITLEANSVYAWERKKHIDIKVMMGEGLVGACAFEGETIFLTEIPDNFVTITSGLGKAAPNCIILIPLKHNEHVLGVIEIASFKIFDEFEIEFLEKVAESIAATIATAKVNVKTRMLLEQSQQQTEEMQAQEEEMRQNMEELLATQEEMSRKEKEISWTLEAIGGLANILEYDFRGNITHINTMLCKTSGYTKEELVGQHHSVLFSKGNNIDSEKYKKFWEDMKLQRPSEGTRTYLNKNGKPFVVKANSYPVFKDNGDPIKVVEISVDITEFIDSKG